MKVLNAYDFVSERMKIRPVTNAEWEQVKKDTNENPFGLTEKDLSGEIEYFPMGIIVRMLEEQQNQGNKPDVTVFQTDRMAEKKLKGFDLDDTKAGSAFWTNIIRHAHFSRFFEKYPEYKKYNVKKTEPNKYNITEKDLVGDIKGFPVSVVVRMLEEQEKQGNKLDVKVFQIDKSADAHNNGFDWEIATRGFFFWMKIIKHKEFLMFFENYPDYVKYNIY